MGLLIDGGTGGAAQLRAVTSTSDGDAVPPGPPIYRVETDRKLVALTFDDGPNGATTDAILGILERKGVDATFYVTGSQATGQRSRLRRMHREGHVIGNHSWSHASLTGLSDDGVRSELQRTSRLIRRVVGDRPTTFRPPYGARSDRVDRIARELGMRDVLWDVDTVDWQRPGADAIRRTAVRNARAGSIILMHDGGGDRSQTVDALGPTIRGLRRRGYEFVTVPELVAAARRG